MRLKMIRTVEGNALAALPLFHIPLVTEQHQRIGVFLSPFTERLNARLGDERNRLPLAWAGNRCPLGVVQRIPQTFRSTIEHQEDILVDITAHPKLIDAALVLTSVNHGQLGQRSPTHRDRLATNVDVDEFVMI